jgi:hypothetical protein
MNRVRCSELKYNKVKSLKEKYMKGEVKYK